MAGAHVAEAGTPVRLFLGTVMQGLVSGCIIALLAAGVTLVHRSARVLNFAQGSFATLNAYVYYQLVVGWGLSAAIAFPATLAFAAVFGAAAEFAAVRPLERADATSRAAGTIGLVLIVQWIVISVWGAQQRFLPPLSDAGVSIGGIRFGAQHLIIVLATVALGAALSIAGSRTRAGLALAASAEDPEAARSLGVSPRAVSRATFVLASVVGAIAGILATPLLVLTPSQMTIVFVVALGASLAGGFASLGLTVAAGLALGVLQNLVTSYAPGVSGLPQASGFVAVLLLLALMRRRGNLIDLARGRS